MSGDNVQIGDQIGGDKIGGDKISGDKIVHNYYDAPADPEKPRLDYEPELVLIPAGPFLMGSDQGSPEEAPQHQVELEAYAIGRFPVTNEQFAQFIWDEGRVAAKPLMWQGNEPPESKLRHPVSGVTWEEALAYCQWLEKVTGRKYRLANEAQWEKAVRGTDGRVYPWGDDWQEGRCNSAQEFSAVDAFPQQSVYGCCDMVGNAREWTVTSWGEQMAAPDRQFAYPWKADRRNHPGEPSTTWRVYRGGRYAEPGGYRCSARGALLPAMRGPKSNRHGFRNGKQLMWANEDNMIS